MSWCVAHIGFEGDDLQIQGLEVWRQHWRAVDIGRIDLQHPAYPNQIHRYDVYEIGEAEKAVRFAAGELSNGVWGFYVPA